MIDNDIIDNGEVDEITRAARAEATKVANKPMIDHLPDAVEKDELGIPVLLAKPGDKLVIERYATILKGSPWLDTKTYTIESIDIASGRVDLWDDDLGRNAITNYVEGLKVGYRFKLPAGRVGIGQRKRGRPRKNPTGVPEETKPVELDANGQPIKKKRGRPPGVKNRPREEIIAEKKAKIQARKEQKS
jgi:hypothetical protein